MHVIDNVHVQGSALIAKHGQVASRQVRSARARAFFSPVEIPPHAISANKTSPVRRGELPKLIILSVAFRRAAARIDSRTTPGPISHPSNDLSLEILNSPFTEPRSRYGY